MEPLHFGADGRLFGLRSEPPGGVRQTAILICQSWGPEYMRSYRALHLLAEQLARRGFETLRFDYSCTGDSAGDSEDARLQDWLGDIHTAVDELRELSGAARICVIGLRLGALLAADAARSGARIDHLALWDPPASGQIWFEQLAALNREHYQRKNRVRAVSQHLQLLPDELLGSPWPGALHQDVVNLQLPVAGTPQRQLHLYSADSADVGAGSSDDRAAGALRLPDEAHWTEIAWLTTPWTPAATPRAICDKLGQWLP